MAEFRWIQMLSFLILMLLFKATTAAAGQNTSTFVVRVGDEVFLPCGQSDCGSAQWLFKGLTSSETVELIHHGTIDKKDKNKSDRLRVTADCSLLIKNIRADDAGRYTCRHFPSLHNQQQYPDFHAHLSVINMTEHENKGEVTLFCSVLDFDTCAHTVLWIYEGEEKPSDMKISARSCTANVTFTISDLNQKSKFYELLKCNVRNQNTKTVKLFPFSRQSSGGTTDPSLLYIIVPVCLAALLIVAAVIIWKKTKGKKAQMEENAGLSLNRAETLSAPGSRQDTDDPKDDVNYVSINHTRKAPSKARAQVHDDEGDTVTYSAVTAPSSYLKVSTDPNDLYSTINN